MNTPIFEEKDFTWAQMITIGQIRIDEDGHVREMHSKGCTVLCPRCNPKSKDKLPLILQAAITPAGVA